MMGQQPRTDSLFYYFRLEDQIPDDHLLKRLDRFIDFGFVRERLRDTYSAIGRPSIDPEVLLRLLLVGYLYGITSESRLMEEVRMGVCGKKSGRRRTSAATKVFRRFASYSRASVDTQRGYIVQGIVGRTSTA
jgi:transposase